MHNIWNWNGFSLQRYKPFDNWQNMNFVSLFFLLKIFLLSKMKRIFFSNSSAKFALGFSKLSKNNQENWNLFESRNEFVLILKIFNRNWRWNDPNQLLLKVQFPTIFRIDYNNKFNIKIKHQEVKNTQIFNKINVLVVAKIAALQCSVCVLW